MRYTADMLRRLGVFGGTFDPPHLGHLILGAEALSQLRLARLLWVLAAQPPHKEGVEISPVADRVAMLKAAIEGEPAFGLSTVDIERSGPHFTLDMLRILRREHPNDQLILVIGGDSLHDLPAWHQPSEVVAACDGIGVMRRPGDEIELGSLGRQLPGLLEKLAFVDAPLLEIASHEIRRRVREGLPFRYYVPAGVHEYIIAHGLYKVH